MRISHEQGRLGRGRYFHSGRRYRPDRPAASRVSRRAADGRRLTVASTIKRRRLGGRRGERADSRSMTAPNYRAIVAQNQGAVVGISDRG